MRKEIFVMLEHNKKLLQLGLMSNSSLPLHFVKYSPFKSCEEKFI